MVNNMLNSNGDNIESDAGYKGQDPRSFEEYAVRIIEQLPKTMVERTRDVVQINYGDEKGVVMIVTPDTMEIRLPTVDWVTPYSPVSSSRIWKRLKWERINITKLKKLIDEAIAIRMSEFAECRYCGKKVPPEHRVETNVCHDCASEHLGIVF